MSRHGLVVYPYLPHYRSGVFELMDADDCYRFTFAAAEEAVQGIETMDSSKLKRFVRLRNRYFRGFLWQKGLLSTCMKAKPDFVLMLADYHYISCSILAFWCKIRRVPVFFWTHGWTREDSRLRHLVKRAHFCLSDSLFLYGNVGKEFGMQSGYPAGKMTVIYNSISKPDVESLPGESPLSTSIRDFAEGRQTLVGAVARLQEGKSLPLIIEAVAHLKKSVPGYEDIGVLFIGDGPEREFLLDLGRRLDVAVAAPGASYDHAELAEFYRCVSVSIMPDKVGLTGIQSMSYGVPVISNGLATGQMPEWEAIRPGETGDYFIPGDSISLSQAIHRVVSGPPMRSACVAEYRARWSPDSQARVIREALDSYFKSVDD